jgi:ribosomal protein S18 acetylase RimI-like enzyme
MITGNIKFQNSLKLRPMSASDNAFIEGLYKSTRDDLRMLQADDEFVEALIDFQRHAQIQGYGEMFPNAMYFIAEHQGEPVGRLVLDFGHNDICVVDIALIPAARGKGYGRQMLQVVQLAASKVRMPVVLSVRFDNLNAKALYAGLGFVAEQAGMPFERLVWYPPASGTHGGIG